MLPQGTQENPVGFRKQLGSNTGVGIQMLALLCAQLCRPPDEDLMGIPWVQRHP